MKKTPQKLKREEKRIAKKKNAVIIGPKLPTRKTESAIMVFWKKYAKRLYAAMTKNVTPQNWQLEFATWTDKEVNTLTALIDRSFVEVKTKFAHQIKDIPQIDLASIKENPKVYEVFKAKQAEHIYYFKKFPKYVQEKAQEHIDDATDKVEFDAQKLAKSLSMIEGISTRHASFIAKDQLAKFSANIHEAQAEACGAKRYIWRTSNDNRVRAEHQKREGKIYAYSTPPSDGNPGSPYGCRCYAEAIIKL